MTPSQESFLVKLWMDEFFDSKACVCSLCGNHGFVNTAGVKSPRGDSVGRQHYCICPNGRKMKQLKVPYVA